MALNELDREKVMNVIENNDKYIKWIEWCLEKLKDQNKELFMAWRD